MPLLITDPVCFRRLPNGDLKFPLEYARGLEAVAIGVATRLRLCRGEWFLNLDIGVPWLPTDTDEESERAAVLGQPFDPIKVRAALLSEILTVPGVFDVPVLRQRFDRPARRLMVTYVARCAFGDTVPDTLALEVPSAA